jgi:hypothetical protein
MEGVQLLKHQFLEARHKRRLAFIEAVRLVPSRRGHVLTEQEAHQLDIAIELFFATATHAHEIAQKFSNLGILLEHFADEGDFSG